jgi:glycosyltransferase involved in cell wall biosynthesis
MTPEGTAMPEKPDCTKRCAVVLPSLNPNEKFDRVVDGLREAGFQRIMIVDDGSDERHQAHFTRAEAFPECSVIHHEGNKGKGRA